MEDWVRKYEVCQMCNGKNMIYLGLLQFLNTPNLTWNGITIYVIEHLSELESKDTILVLVDRFT